MLSLRDEHANETSHYPLWDEVKFIDRDPNNNNRDNGIEIPEARMSTVKKHSRRMVQQRTPEGTTSRRNIANRNAPTTADHRDINGAA